MSLGYLYDIILSPVNTEKTQKQLAENKFTFLVNLKASKDDIAHAMKEIFCIDVEKINITNIKGKVKKFKGVVGKKSDIRKAVVSVKKGQEINFIKLEDK